MLEAIASRLKKSGKTTVEVFCTWLTTPYEGLSLTVEPVGKVTFPVSARMAKSLIVEAELARFGHKDKTLLDRSIRDTWEIQKDRVHIDQKWSDQLRLALQTIKKDLNLPADGELRADLHNLLIYMPGQFFKAHQDSEKADGMVATLLILLPSEFTGGTLVIDQHGDRKVFEAQKSDKNLTFIAFYSDCYHEVKEVTSGYRLALTYNLFFKPLSKSITSTENVELNKEVQSYFSQPSEHNHEYRDKRPRWLVYLLDHEYTRSSLGWPNLKGKDRDRVGELLACADHLNLTAHLALADVHEMWSTEGDDNWGGRYGRRWRYDEDDEEAIQADSTDYELSELIEDEIILRHWITRAGNKFEEWDKYVPRGMVCWTKAVDEFKPFKSEYEGYMGNYGNTLDRWYHRAAIVLWQKELDLVNLFICDKTEALRIVGETLSKNIEQGQKAARELLPYWPDKIHRFLDPVVVLDVANRLKDQELAFEFVKTAGIGALREKNLLSFSTLLESYGENWFIPILDFWRRNREWDDEDSIMDELKPLVSQFAEKHKKISHWILKDQLSLLVQSDLEQEKHSNRREIREKLSKRFKVVEIILKVSQFAGAEIHSKLVDHVLQRKNLYPEVELANLFSRLDEVAYSKALFQLEARVKKQMAAPRKEGDWSIRDSVPDNCSDCDHLRKFLGSSSAHQLVWPLAKDRRQHIHQIIDAMDIPVTHETIRKGSPHKLVLKKTPELFAKDLAPIQIFGDLFSQVKWAQKGQAHSPVNY